MSEETKTRPASEVNLPKILDDGSWEWPVGDKKYKLREATIGEIAEASAGARSQDDKDIRKLSLVTQQQDKNGKWVPLEWPKGGAERLYNSLIFGYMMGIGALEVRTKNSSKPTSEATPKTPQSGDSAKQST